jgi:hypothetical protein
MANTWTAYAAGIAHAASAKNYLQIYQSAASTQTIKVYRIWLINAQSAAVTGVISGALKVTSHSTAWSTSTAAVTAIAHDTTNAALNANIAITSGGTTTGTLVNTYRTFPFASDEPATGTFKLENFFATPSTALIWDAGFESSVIQPLTIPAGTAGSISVNGTMTAVGNIDIAMEFTIE